MTSAASPAHVLPNRVRSALRREELLTPHRMNLTAPRGSAPRGIHSTQCCWLVTDWGVKHAQTQARRPHKGHAPWRPCGCDDCVGYRMCVGYWAGLCSMHVLRVVCGFWMFAAWAIRLREVCTILQALIRTAPSLTMEHPGTEESGRGSSQPGGATRLSTVQEGASGSRGETADSRPDEIPGASGVPQEGEPAESQRTDPGQPASDSARASSVVQPSVT